MNIKKILVTISLFSLGILCRTETVYASEIIYTNHGTYITNGHEYYSETNSIVELSHSDNCVAYLNALNPVPVYPEVIPEQEIDVIPSDDELNNGDIEDVPMDSDSDVDEILPDDNLDDEDVLLETVSPDTDIHSFIEPATAENKNVNLVRDTWYHPVKIKDAGFTGKVDMAILKDNFISNNWDKFILKQNPFSLGQCTYFAWSRFYQIYGFDSHARGNGKTNAAEIAKALPDRFVLSSTPSAGSVFSAEANTLYPQYGHVGFVEAVDDEYIWISEGNVTFGEDKGMIWIHKMKIDDFMKLYPDVVFAVPTDEFLLQSKLFDLGTMVQEHGSSYLPSLRAI